MVKVCCKCKIEKIMMNLVKIKPKRWFANKCKSCCKEYSQANKEIIKEYKIKNYKEYKLIKNI
jgi:hypothetical protein